MAHDDDHHHQRDCNKKSTDQNIWIRSEGVICKWLFYCSISFALCITKKGEISLVVKSTEEVNDASQIVNSFVRFFRPPFLGP